MIKVTKKLWLNTFLSALIALILLLSTNFNYIYAATSTPKPSASAQPKDEKTSPSRCNSTRVARNRTDMLALIRQKIIHPKKQIDSKVAEAAKRYKRRFLDRGVSYSEVSNLIANTQQKKTQLEQMLQNLINDTNKLTCGKLNEQRQNLFNQMLAIMPTLLEYKLDKKNLVIKINQLLQARKAEPSPTPFETVQPSGSTPPNQ